MQRSNGARLLPLFIILIVIALVIAALVSVGRAIFNQDEPTTTSETASDSAHKALLNTSVGHSVAMTVRGPIVANEAFKSYKIDISSDTRRMSVYTGYLENRTNGSTLGNNIPAYEQFVYALDKANMMKGTVPADDAANDLRGICATGYVYEFAVLNDDKSVKRLWTSTCVGSKGTLDASKEQLGNLFLAQIPNSNDLVPFRQSPILHF